MPVYKSTPLLCLFLLCDWWHTRAFKYLTNFCSAEGLIKDITGNYFCRNLFLLFHFKTRTFCRWLKYNNSLNYFLWQWVVGDVPDSERNGEAKWQGSMVPVLFSSFLEVGAIFWSNILYLQYFIVIAVVVFLTLNPWREGLGLCQPQIHSDIWTRKPCRRFCR